MPVALFVILNLLIESLLPFRVMAVAPGAETTGSFTPRRWTSGVLTVAPAYGAGAPHTSTVSPGLAVFTPPWIVVYAGPDPAQLPGDARPSWSTMIVAPNAAAAVSASVAPTVTGTVAHRIRILVLLALDEPTRSARRARTVNRGCRRARELAISGTEASTLH